MVDGAAYSVGGLVGKGEPVPSSLALVPGETWDTLDHTAVNDAGAVVLTGRTSESHFLLAEGPLASGPSRLVLLRDGAALGGGWTSHGSLRGARLNNRGDVVAVWDVKDPAGGTRRVLVFNRHVILVVGDRLALDLDGDGVLEQGTLTAVWLGSELNPIAVDGQRNVYVRLQIDVLGTVDNSDDPLVAARVAIPDVLADVASISLSTGGVAELTLFGPTIFAGAAYSDDFPESYLLLGSLSGTEPGVLVDGLVLPLNFDAYTSFTLTSPNSAPLLGGVGQLDPDWGTGTATLRIAALPDPSLAGTIVSHAFVALDPVTGAVVFASDAADIELTP